MVGFQELTDKYRQKHYPEGYFASVAKGSGGLVLVVCGVVLALIGICPAAIPVDYLLGGMDDSMDISVLIFFIILALVFLGGGILVIIFGIKRMRMGKHQWMEKCAESSNYPMSNVEEFESQFMRTDTLIFQLDTSGVTNVLTTDYILWGNLLAVCLIKLSDIVGAYLVNLPDTIMVGNRTKKVITLNVAIFSNHNTSIVLSTREKTAHELLDLLVQRNPNIDTADRRVLHENEYETIKARLKNE